MPDRLTEHINAQLREVRARSFSPDNHDGINAALRLAAGRDPGPPTSPQDSQQQPAADPRTASSQLLAEATAGVRDSEPLTGSERDFDAWVHSRPVLTLLDEQGRLPGERGYRASTTGRALGSDWDMQAAIDARRDRWKSLGG